MRRCLSLLHVVPAVTATLQASLCYENGTFIPCPTSSPSLDNTTTNLTLLNPETSTSPASNPQTPGDQSNNVTSTNVTSGESNNAPTVTNPTGIGSVSPENSLGTSSPQPEVTPGISPSPDNQAVVGPDNQANTGSPTVESSPIPSVLPSDLVSNQPSTISAVSGQDPLAGANAAVLGPAGTAAAGASPAPDAAAAAATGVSPAPDAAAVVPSPEPDSSSSAGAQASPVPDSSSSVVSSPNPGSLAVANSPQPDVAGAHLAFACCMCMHIVQVL